MDNRRSRKCTGSLSADRLWKSPGNNSVKRPDPAPLSAAKCTVSPLSLHHDRVFHKPQKTKTGPDHVLLPQMPFSCLRSRGHPILHMQSSSHCSLFILLYSQHFLLIRRKIMLPYITGKSIALCPLRRFHHKQTVLQSRQIIYFRKKPHNRFVFLLILYRFFLMEPAIPAVSSHTAHISGAPPHR